ncbi:aminotransferase class V-fold PLP-dependent enzyme [bacterium]|nr:aminotransferase class V-fold PLP-dependent enzyme [bacterium]
MIDSPYLADQFNATVLQFNHASMGPLAVPVHEAISEFLLEWGTGRVRYFPQLQSLQSDIKQSLASLLETIPNRFSLQQNTATSFSILAQGLDLKPGDEVVLLEQDFPSVTLPFLNASEQRGFQIRFIPYAEFLKNPLAALDAVISPRTRLFVFSWVGFMSGVRHPLKDILDYCKSKRVWVAADGTQGVGACRFSFKEIPVDFLACSVYKWLLSPQGIAFFHISDELADRVRPPIAGWLSQENPSAMYFDRLERSNTGAQYENGGQSMLSMVGMRAALRFLESAGWDLVQVRTAGLSKRLADGLIQKGYTLSAQYTDENRTGIVTIRLENGGDDLFAELENNRVVATHRLGQIRFSPYFYQTTADIDRLLGILP